MTAALAGGSFPSVKMMGGEESGSARSLDVAKFEKSSKDAIK